MVVFRAYLGDASLLLEESRDQSWLLSGSYLLAEAEGSVRIRSPRENFAKLCRCDREAVGATHIDHLSDLLLACLVNAKDEILKECGLYDIILREVFQAQLAALVASKRIQKAI